MDAMDCLWSHIHGAVRSDEQATLHILGDLLDLDVVNLDQIEPDPVLVAAVSASSHS